MGTYLYFVAFFFFKKKDSEFSMCSLTIYCYWFKMQQYTSMNCTDIFPSLKNSALFKACPTLALVFH